MYKTFSKSVITMIVGAFAIIAPHALAQQSDTVIARITIEGNQRIEDRTVQSYLLVKPGDPFDANRIDQSLKTLFATGLFADAAFEQSGSELIVRVVENPVVNRVMFEGNSAIKDDKLREEIQVAPRGIFTSARVQADVQRILELYRRGGRFSVTIEPQYKALEQNRVDLIFIINEGPVTGISAINFIGNDVFSDSRLRDVIVTRQSRWWRFFSSNDNYDPGRLEYDRELLQQFYQNRGYYDFQIVSVAADLKPDKKSFYITYTVEEGEIYRFGDVKVETTLDKLDDAILERIIPFRTGDLFRGDVIEETIDTLTYAAGIAGYAFVNIIPNLEPDPETQQINTTFMIDEGPRVYIERINIFGNTSTLDRVIRRELRIAEGDAFNRVLLDRSRNRLRALGYFKEVEIEERPGSQPDRTIVDIKVEEQSTGEAGLSAGFSSLDSYMFDLSITQRNLLGRGQAVSGRMLLSSRQRNLSFSFQEPRFLDRNLSASIDLFTATSDYRRIAGFQSNTTGGGIGFGFPLSENTGLSLRYRLQLNKINVRNRNIVLDTKTGRQATEIRKIDRNIPRTPNDPSDDTEIQVAIPPSRVPLPDGTRIVDQCSTEFLFRPPLCNSERSDVISMIGYSFNWDRRNDPIAPTRGFDFGITQDLAGIGGDVRYLRTEMSGTVYRGIAKDVRASLRLFGGYIQPFGDNDSIRINNRFFRGGSNFRGFDVAGIGPRIVDVLTREDGTTEVIKLSALGGKAYYQATAELTFPNYLPEEYGVSTKLFLEAGGLGLLDDADIQKPVSFVTIPGQYRNVGSVQAVRKTEDSLALRATTGLSIGWNSPFGPIQFNFSYILKKEDYDKTKTFHFSTSTRF